MNKPLKVDNEGIIIDSQCLVVGIVSSVYPDIRATLIYRLNLFDDMFRSLEALRQYASDLPPMVKADADMTIAAANLAK